MKCGYCGHISHHQDECAFLLQKKGRWNEGEWEILGRLAGLQQNAQRYSLKMYEMPEAVELFAKLGGKYKESP